MNPPALFTTTDAAVEASIRLRAIGYHNASVKPRNMLNLEAKGAIGPWPRNSANERQLTGEDVDQLVRYFAGHWRTQGIYSVDSTPTTDPEDRA